MVDVSSRRNRHYCCVIYPLFRNINTLAQNADMRRRLPELQKQARRACRCPDSRPVLFATFRALHAIPFDAREQGQPSVGLSQYAQYGRHEPKVEDKERQRNKLKPMQDHPSIHLTSPDRGPMRQILVWISATLVFRSVLAQSRRAFLPSSAKGCPGLTGKAVARHSGPRQEVAPTHE
jgi:hypothetical protein